MIPIFISYWWGRDKICRNTRFLYNNKKRQKNFTLTYNQLAERLEKNLKDLQLECHIEEHSEFDNEDMYQVGINHKPFFILNMIRKFKRPVVYIDIDMIIHEKPLLFDTDYFDFMAFNWNADPRVGTEIDFGTFETNGEVFYFNNTVASVSLLLMWCWYSRKFPKKADDRILSTVFHKYNFLEQYKIKCYWLPMEYLHIPQYYIIDDPIIQHPHKLTNEHEAWKLGASRNRSMKYYDNVINKDIKHHNIVTENLNVYFNDEQQKHLKNRNQSFECYTQSKDPDNTICHNINEILNLHK